MKHKVSTTVNGTRREHEVESRLLLVHYLRDVVGLTGTHIGCDTSQCGACTPGFIMSAAYLLSQNPNPTEDEIRRGLEGNLCRCTGYVNIIKSVQSAAKAMHGSKAKAGQRSAAVGRS